MLIIYQVTTSIFRKVANISVLTNLKPFLFHSMPDHRTMEVNFDIGQEIIDGFYGGDLPKERQQYELSARYYGKKRSSGTGGLTTSNDSNSRMIMMQPLGGNETQALPTAQTGEVAEATAIATVPATQTNEGFSSSDGGPDVMCAKKNNLSKKIGGPKFSVHYTDNPGMHFIAVKCGLFRFLNGKMFVQT